MTIRDVLLLLFTILLASCATYHKPPVASPPTAPAPRAGSATVHFHASWGIPTLRDDGTPLDVSEIARYNIFYTKDTSGDYVTVPIEGGTTTSAEITEVLPASQTPYVFSFYMTSIDTAGRPSGPSNYVDITITADAANPCAPPDVTVDATCSTGKCTILVSKKAPATK